mgnify:CR=1 FL=1
MTKQSAHRLRFFFVAILFTLVLAVVINLLKHPAPVQLQVPAAAEK